MPTISIIRNIEKENQNIIVVKLFFREITLRKIPNVTMIVHPNTAINETKRTMKYCPCFSQLR